MNRRAAFTPLHHPNCEPRPIFPGAPECRVLKRHKCRAPIPAAPPAKQKPVERLVDCILAAKTQDASADVSALEREIDELVYALYGLTPDEIKIVEDSVK
jgi:endonuclease III